MGRSPTLPPLQPYDVLLVEDDLATRMLLERLLRARGHTVTPCESAEEALAKMADRFYPIILLDIQLPGMSGVEFASAVRNTANGDAHYIMVGTGNTRPEDLRKILEAGADDYIAKPYHPILLSVRLAVAESAAASIAKRKALEEELRYLANHDTLTGLSNRTGLNAKLLDAIELARAGRHGAVLYLDLDNFKIVNDTLGHDAGDELLVRVAEHLRTVARAEDEVVRFGGDEFVIVMPGQTIEAARQRAEALCDAIETLGCPGKDVILRVGASIGLAVIDGLRTPSEVMSFADEACYAAKARGRNRVEIHSDETGAIARLIMDTDWTSRIRAAMREDQLQLWFQPILSVRTGRCLAQEVLVRYAGGLAVSPPVFLDALRRAGQMGAFDRFMIARAFEALAGHPDLALSINISGQLFTDKDYAQFIESMLNESEILPSRVLFEITEDEIIQNLQTASGSIRRLQRMGCRFGLDDFGAGFSSLTYLRELPIDFLKIDGAFTRGIASQPFHVAVLCGIKTITDTLGIETVAECVESREELEVISGVGIDYAQGFLYAQPRPEPFTLDEIDGLTRALP